MFRTMIAAKAASPVAGAVGGMIQQIQCWYYNKLGAVAAAKFEGTFDASSATENNGFNKIIAYIMKGLMAAGILFLVIGGVSIATAIKSGEQNPEAITGAVKNLLVGGLLMGLGGIISLFK